MKQIPLVLWLLGFPTLWHLTGGFPEIVLNTDPNVSVGIFWTVYIIAGLFISDNI